MTQGLNAGCRGEYQTARRRGAGGTGRHSQGRHRRLRLVQVCVRRDRGDRVAAYALRAERRTGERRVQNPLIGGALARYQSGEENSIRIEVNRRYARVVRSASDEQNLRADGCAGGDRIRAASRSRRNHSHFRRGADRLGDTNGELKCLSTTRLRVGCGGNNLENACSIRHPGEAILI